jgi:hypothetical protein
MVVSPKPGLDGNSGFPLDFGVKLYHPQVFGRLARSEHSGGQPTGRFHIERSNGSIIVQQFTACDSGDATQCCLGIDKPPRIVTGGADLSN